jgi:hypothetical protein
MKKELFLSDFNGDLRLRSLSTKVWNKLDLLKFLDLYAIRYLVRKNILVINKSEKTGLPCYTVRDGFIDG